MTQKTPKIDFGPPPPKLKFQGQKPPPPQICQIWHTRGDKSSKFTKIDNFRVFRVFPKNRDFLLKITKILWIFTKIKFIFNFFTILTLLKFFSSYWSWVSWVSKKSLGGVIQIHFSIQLNFQKIGWGWIFWMFTRTQTGTQLKSVN